MNKTVDYTLYLVTDRSLMSTKTVEEAVKKSIAGGCTLVQLREKDCSSLEFYKIAMSVKKITDHHGIPLIINDRIDIALAVDAAGAHIGQSDIPARVARRILGVHKLLGVSASTLSEAQQAQADRADYLGIGALFATDTKTDAVLTPLTELQAIRAHIQLPLVVIGGMNEKTIPLVAPLGIEGIAVVSAVIAQPDIEQATKKLKALFLRGSIHD